MDIPTKATTRLRRTFAYPTDETTSNSSASPAPEPALDEQEQEELIEALARQNESRNAQFRVFLLALPVLSTVPYIIVLCRGAAGLLLLAGGGDNNNKTPAVNLTGVRVADFWVAVLSLTSLACTAWMLWTLPPGATGVRVLDAWVASSSASGSNGNRSGGSGALAGLDRDEDEDDTTLSLGPLGANARRRRRASFSFWAEHRSPLEQYLPYLNVGLCAVLVLTGSLATKATAAAEHWGHVGLGNLPAVVFVVVLVAKMVMGSVDPEKELSALRYECKGA